ncbi:hypothetical protein K7711_37345 [Nocardia sp. CA2R105]|nr:hypothetical protein [Nocardia coffeae]
MVSGELGNLKKILGRTPRNTAKITGRTGPQNKAAGDEAERRAGVRLPQRQVTVIDTTGRAVTIQPDQIDRENRQVMEVKNTNDIRAYSNCAVPAVSRREFRSSSIGWPIWRPESPDRRPSIAPFCGPGSSAASTTSPLAAISKPSIYSISSCVTSRRCRSRRWTGPARPCERSLPGRTSSRSPRCWPRRHRDRTSSG